MFRNTETSGFAVNKVRYVDHHIRKHLYQPLLCLNPHKRNCRILNRIRHLRSDLLTLLSKNLAAERVNHILRKNLVPDSVL